MEGAWFGGMPDHIPPRATKVVSSVLEREVILFTTELRFSAERSLDKHTMLKLSITNPFSLLHIRFTKATISVL